jgi:RHS repeat-associated core domain
MESGSKPDITATHFPIDIATSEAVSIARAGADPRQFLLTRQLDNRSRVAGITLQDAAGSEVSSTTYAYDSEARGVGGLLATRMNGQWYFPLYDNNGNIIAYLDANGAVEAEYCYDAFGKVLSYSGMEPQKFRHTFSAKWYDWHTTFYDYGRRFYNPRLMRRWLNRDPIEEDGGLNLYSFCENNAVNGFDVLGLDPEFGIKAAFSFSMSNTGRPEMSLILTGGAKQTCDDHLKISADIGFRILSGGHIGSSKNGATRSTYEIFGNISGIIGNGKGNSTPFFFNGSQWGSVFGDDFSTSFSAGQTLYYNSALNERVRMGNLRFQGSGFFMNYNNDQKHFPYGLGDGGDRGWTGGGMLGFSVGGNTVGAAFDDFSGRASGTSLYNPSNPNNQTPYSKGLNQAQWSIGAIGDFNSVFFMFDSPDWLNVQHWIHSTISTEAGYFEYPKNLEYRIKINANMR